MIQGAASPAPSLVSWYLPRASAFFAVLAFVFGLLYNRRTKTPENFEGHLVRVVAASAIPPALVLVYAGYDPDVIARAEGFINVPLTLAGLALLYISIKGTLSLTRQKKSWADSGSGSLPSE
jgi:hypothetical protein